MDINQKLQALLRSVADNKGKAGAAAITTVLLLVIVALYRRSQDPMKRLEDFAKKWGIVIKFSFKSNYESSYKQLINNEKEAEQFLIELLEILKDRPRYSVPMNASLSNPEPYALRNLVLLLNESIDFASEKLGNKFKLGYLVTIVEGTKVDLQDATRLLHALCYFSNPDPKIIKLLVELGATINEEMEYSQGPSDNKRKVQANALDMVNVNNKSTPELCRALLLSQLEMMTATKAATVEMTIHHEKLNDKLSGAINDINEEHGNKYKIDRQEADDNTVKIVMSLVGKGALGKK